MIRVLLVDDEALIRAGLRALLSADPDILVVGEAADGSEALTVVRQTSPDVVLMDIRMPTMDGVEATRQIFSDEQLRGVHVIMTTSFEVGHDVVDSLRAGASGFLLKDSGPKELVRAVQIVAAGDALLAPSVTRHLIAEIRGGRRAADPVDPELVAVLTTREREVMSLVATGLSNDEIAARLFITPATVKTHVGRTLAKVGLRSRAQLVVLAYETGLAALGGSELSYGR